MYAILDIETTGGKYDEECITEIAIYRHDGESITDQFSSLVNPQIEIQPFVQKLTGISTRMLQNAAPIPDPCRAPGICYFFHLIHCYKSVFLL